MTLRSQMRQLSSQSLVYGLSGALSKLVGLVMTPILLRIFQPGEFAVLDLVTAFGTAIGAVLLLGSDAAVGYYYYREVDDDGRQRLLSTWLLFQFTLSTLVGAIIFILADPITNHLLSSSAHNDLYLQITGIVLPLTTTTAYCLEILRLQLQPRRYLFVSTTNIAFGFLISLILVVALHKGIPGVYVASALSNVVAFSAALIATGSTFRLRFSLVRLRQVLVFGIPLVPITVSSWAIAMANRLFIKANSGMADVGLFSAGNKVAQILLLAVTAFLLAWGPFAYSIAEEPDAKRTYAKVLTYYVAVLGWLVVALSLLAPLILHVASRPTYARAYQVVPPLTLSLLVGGAYSIVALGASLSRKTIHLTWTTVLGAGVTVCLNVLLLPIPLLSLVGGALASLGGNLLWVGLVFVVSQRLYFIPYETSKVFRCALLLALLLLFGQVEHGWLASLSIPDLLLRSLLTGAYPFLLVRLGVIEPHEAELILNRITARLKH